MSRPTPPPLSLDQLSTMLGVSIPSDVDAQLRIERITTLEEAGPSDISFVQRNRFAAQAEQSRAGLVLVTKNVRLKRSGALVVPHLMEAVLTLLEYFHPEAKPSGQVHPTAVIDPSAQLAAGVTVGPYAVIESDAVLAEGAVVGAHCYLGQGVLLGKNTVLHPRVTVLARCQLGARVLVHTGAVIGADGFRFEVARGRLSKVPQVGIVVVEDDVEIGANTTIDRASFSETRIGARVKIDNQVHIAHNVVIGSDSIIVAQVGVAGSVKIGRGALIGGQVGIADNLTVGDGARIAGASGVHGNVAAGAEIIGNPAIPKREYARERALMKTLRSKWPKLRPMLADDEDSAPSDSV